MRRVLLISLSLVLALVGWSAVNADDGFYVIPFRRKCPPVIGVPTTGQTTSYAPGDDGDLEKGVAWLTPRFTDNRNGTVTDNFTRLIWMKNANAFDVQSWDNAISFASRLKSGDPGTGLTDRSQEGDWRLPNVRELQSLVDYAFLNPALPDTLGTGKWVEGDPFLGVQSNSYWTSTTSAFSVVGARFVSFIEGTEGSGSKENYAFVWCVRDDK